jgi:hypothetical protein
MNGYDIIGDIHGHAAELSCLLEAMGYERKRGAYRHPERRVALFLGDFIDRGPENRAVIEIVRTMIDEGAALAVMGNHEYNAICYHTRHPDTGEPLRPHTPKNEHQHHRFLAEYGEEGPALEEVITWFQSLPLFLELPEGFRLIHACWHEPSVTHLAQDADLAAGNRLSESLLFASAEPTTEAFDAVEALLKGIELDLPDGHFISDKDGIRRKRIRQRWWYRSGTTFRELAALVSEHAEQVPEQPAPLEECYWYPEDSPPVFFGHYWMRAESNPVGENALCLDLSVAMDGHLAAYRCNGESRITPENVVLIPQRERRSRNTNP